MPGRQRVSLQMMLFQSLSESGSSNRALPIHTTLKGVIR